MKRLTTDAPNGNFETALNFVYGKNGWAYIRHDGEHEDVMLTDLAKRQCKLHGCDEVLTETPEEIDERICDCMMDGPICLVALAYCFATQAVHLRSRLKMYEDIGLMPEEITSLMSPSNDPLTLEELRGMAGEPVWIAADGIGRYDVYQGCANHCLEQFYTAALPSSSYGTDWLAYRRRPEEGSK